MLEVELPAGALISMSVPILLALGVFLHELAHGMAARTQGVPVKEYVLSMWGGHTAFSHEARRPLGMALIAVAGPAVNVVLAGVAYWATGHTDGPVSYVLWVLALTNGLVAVFNLLPAAPLDGGKLLQAALWGVGMAPLRAMMISGWAGYALAIGLPVGAFLWVNSGPIEGQGLLYWPLLAALVGATIFPGAQATVNQARARSKTADLDLLTIAQPTVAADRGMTVAQVDMVTSAETAAVIVVDQGYPVALVDPAAFRSVPTVERPRTMIEMTALAVAPEAIVSETLGSDAVAQVAAAARAGHAFVVLYRSDLSPRLLVVRDLAQIIQQR